MRQEDNGINRNNDTEKKRMTNAQDRRRSQNPPAAAKASASKKPGTGSRSAGSAHTSEKRRAVKDEREVVLLALLSHEKNETFSNVLVRRTLDDCADMSTVEKAFIKRLLEGVIERKTELDARIEHFTGRSVSRLHPALHQILRMGIYQIYYMDSVPDSAVCNEAVRLAKRHGPARLSGFVNGVLRNAAREAASADGRDRALTAKAAERAADRKAGRKADRRADRAGDRKEERAADRKADRKAERTADRKADTAVDRTADRKADTAADRTADSNEPADELEIFAARQSLKYSMPEWLVRMWMDQLGMEETEKLLDALMEIRPVSVRLSSRLSAQEQDKLLSQLSEAGVVIEEGRWLPFCRHLRKTSDLRRLPGFRDGLWTVQDESSMLAVEAAGLKGTEIVFDVCAAPGGKSFLAAEQLIARNSHFCESSEKTGGNSAAGMVFSFDLSRQKTDLIRSGAERLQLDNIRVRERDAREFFEEDTAKADVIFCDLPCSGLGVMGKKRDIKYRASMEGLTSLQQLQRQILENSVRYLRSGGILIYSTCTINRAENEENAAWIEKELGLQPQDLSSFLPEGIPGICGNMLQLLPHVHGTDGFFISRFRKA